ncbi:MAG: hypothetical protein WDM77_05915 [Steroidobacteraceae bacterium]
MTQKLEEQLRQAFARSDESFPVSDVTPKVMSEVHKLRRRERLLWSSALVAAFAFLWFVFPDLQVGFRTVAGAADDIYEGMRESVVSWSRSPLAYIYGIALGGYVILRLMHRLRIRMM